MMGNPLFHEILHECAAIHDKKNQDYANEKDTHANFKLIEKFADMFRDLPTRHQPYIYLLGVKFARLAELLKEKKSPNFESVDDSFIDAINYLTLWAARVKANLEPIKDLVVTDNQIIEGNYFESSRDVEKRISELGKTNRTHAQKYDYLRDKGFHYFETQKLYKHSNGITLPNDMVVQYTLENLKSAVDNAFTNLDRLKDIPF